jgi:hypothetical protein
VDFCGGITCGFDLWNRDTVLIHLVCTIPPLTKFLAAVASEQHGVGGNACCMQAAYRNICCPELDYGISCLE